MIIIIEGVDRVGKTTLCDKLSKELNIPVYKKDRVSGNDDNTDMVNMINYYDAKAHLSFWKSDVCKNLDFIIDRFQWTEIVYSLMLRNNLNHDMYLVDNELMGMQNIIMVYMKPLNIEQSSKEHGVDLSMYDEMFDNLYNEYTGHKILTNYDLIDLTVELIKSIKTKSN